jgi:hypothetical protein
VPKIDRLDVRAVYCPECKAAPGEPCVRADGAPRAANHQTRVNLASRMLRGAA